MNFINAKNHKLLYILPIVIGLACLFLIFVYPGISTGIDLKGGNQLIVRYEGEKIDTTTLSSTLKQRFGILEVNINETKGPTGIGLIIEYSNSPEIETARSEKNKLDFTNGNIDDLKAKSLALLTALKDKGYIEPSTLDELSTIRNKEDLKGYLNDAINLANNAFNSQLINEVKSELNLSSDAKIQTREVSATLGKDFVNTSIKVGVIALVLLSIVILLFFKEIIPSGLILFAACFDILAGLAGMAILRLPLSLTTIPTLLMLLGYSVDTDVLLSTKLLKNRTDDVYVVTNKAMATGLTMTITTIVTVLVMLVVSYFMQMTVVLDIAAILFFGLLGDIVSTWCFNAPMLITYVQKKNKNKS